MTQKTRSQFQSDMAVLLADNSSGDISALDARTVQTDLSDSAIFPEDTTAIETAYNTEVDVVDQSTAEAGTSTTVVRWTPQRVAQAIAALGSGSLAGDLAGNLDFDEFGIVITGTNNTGATLDKGTPVKFDGAGYDLIVSDSDGTGTMPADGVVAADIADTASGKVMLFGVLVDMDTSSYSDNDLLYVSTTAGELTATAPTGSFQQVMGQVITSDVTNGIILVKPEQVVLPTGALTTEAIVEDDHLVFLNDSDSDNQIERTMTNFMLDIGVPVALGTVSSGTETLVFSFGRVQTLTNGGAFTLAPPSSGEGTLLLEITNNASAGAITTTGFDSVKGDIFDTTDGNTFSCYVRVIGSRSYLTVEASSDNS